MINSMYIPRWLDLIKSKKNFCIVRMLETHGKLYLIVSYVCVEWILPKEERV